MRFPQCNMPLATTTLILAAAAVGSCGRSQRDLSPEGLIAAVSIAPQEWLVREIGGERWNVFPLIQPGDSPASYQPSDAQISRLMQADLYFGIGVPFESGAWFDAIDTQSGPTVVDLREGITLRRMQGHVEQYGPSETARAHDHGPEGFDPHIWLAPELLAIQAGTVASALTRSDPEHAAEYEANLRRIETILQTLHLDLQQRFEDLERRRFYIFHPAWGYFTDAYGLEQIAVEVEGKEPTDAELTALQRMARRDGATVIFVQPQIRGGTVKVLAAAIGGRVEVLDPLAPDVLDNLIRAADALIGALR